MSRAMNLALAESTVLARCAAEKIGVSAIEALPSGGVRLVCMSSEGAALVRKKMKKDLMRDDIKRRLHRPTRPLW